MTVDKVFVNVSVPIERQVIVEVRHAGDLYQAEVFAEAEREVREAIHADPAGDFWTSLPTDGPWQVEPNGLGEEINAYDYADQDADRIFATVTLKERSA